MTVRNPHTYGYCRACWESIAPGAAAQSKRLLVRNFQEATVDTPLPPTRVQQDTAHKVPTTRKKRPPLGPVVALTPATLQDYVLMGKPDTEITMSRAAIW